MSTISAITIDFWNTLVDSSNSKQRRDLRNDAIRRVFEAMHRRWDQEAVNEAFRIAYERFEKCWYGDQRTMRADETAAILWEELTLNVPPDLHKEAVSRMELSVLEAMPQLFPDASDVLAVLSEKKRIALISDTAISPGGVLRQVLERHNVAGYFHAMVFSDEIGVAKPHSLAFSTALKLLGAKAEAAVHIGDIERTDIKGAKAGGMKAILFRGDTNSRYFLEQNTERTEADAVAHTWREITDIIRRWDVAATEPASQQKEM